MAHTAENDRGRTVDQAALIGVALAAVLALTLDQGEWDWFDVAVGLALAGALAGFYQLPKRISPSALGEITAHAAILGLTVLMVASWLFEWWSDREQWSHECAGLADFPPGGTYQQWQVGQAAQNCRGDFLFDWMAWRWIIAAAVIFAIDIVIVRGKGKPGRNSSAGSPESSAAGSPGSGAAGNPGSGGAGSPKSEGPTEGPGTSGARSRRWLGITGALCGTYMAWRMVTTRHETRPEARNTAADLRRRLGAGEGNRTPTVSLGS